MSPIQDPTKKGAVAIDFDGVINSYVSGFVALDKIPDPPVPGAIDYIKMLLREKYKVFIFSTRNLDISGTRAVKDYLETHGLSRDEMAELEFPTSKPRAILYVDDRGYHFTGDNFPSTEFIDSFKPWTKRESSSKI